MILSIIFFVVILSVLVLVHELGHFFVARRSGVKVEEFGFGFPPRLFAKRLGKTIFSFNWLPFGGFVKIKGVGDLTKKDNPEETSDSFLHQSFFRKIFILTAGVLMNIILAIILFAISFRLGILQDSTNLNPDIKIISKKIFIADVLDNSPAHLAGLIKGDQLIKYDEWPIENIEKFQQYFKSKDGQEVKIVFQRNNVVLETRVVPQNLNWQEESFVGIGISMQELALVQYPVWQAGFQALTTSGVILLRIFLSLGSLINGIFSGEDISAQVTGPVGIMVLTNTVAKFGFSEILQFAAMLSLNFAVFNLIPFPALDGGRIFFVILEKIIRKPVNQKVETLVHNIGFAILLLLVLLVTIKDIRQFSLFSVLRRIIS